MHMDEITTDNATADSPANATHAPPTSDFAEGDLGRIQGILLGDHARRVDDRLATLEQALLGAIADLRTEVQSAVAELRGSVATEGSNRAKAMQNMSDRIDTEIDLRSEGEAALMHKLELAEGSMRSTIASERAATVAGFDAEMTALRARSVNRKNLAEILSATAEQLLED